MTNLHNCILELKSRFFYLMFSTLCTFFLFYCYQIEIVYIVGKPFIELQHTFIFLDLTEAFYTLVRVSTILTILVMIPFFFYHFWSFFIPSCYKLERKRITFFFIFFLCVFLSEISFTYFFLLPKICHFLLSFEMASNLENSDLHLQPLLSVEFTARIESYVKLIVKISTVIFLIFQIPLCVCLLYSKKVLHVSSFYQNRKICCLISLLLSAFLVPPDLVSQLTVAMFFSILCEFLIFIGFFFE
uniref:SecY-independent transporter protein n=1 Tax=Micractinium pusillum TaxID=126839 RepID=A0A650F1U4_9CHLO|nr:SecY-independent transporter protein [Micractinium pusillum]